MFTASLLVILGSSFVCPALSGHFPDPDTCSVYYTCAGGSSHRNTCQTGLMYNSLTNQCDWEASVDCSINKAFFRARPWSQFSHKKTKTSSVGQNNIPDCCGVNQIFSSLGQTYTVPYTEWSESWWALKWNIGALLMIIWWKSSSPWCWSPITQSNATPG